MGAFALGILVGILVFGAIYLFLLFLMIVDE